MGALDATLEGLARAGTGAFAFGALILLAVTWPVLTPLTALLVLGTALSKVIDDIVFYDRPYDVVPVALGMGGSAVIVAGGIR